MLLLHAPRIFQNRCTSRPKEISAWAWVAEPKSKLDYYVYRLMSGAAHAAHAAHAAPAPQFASRAAETSTLSAPAWGM